MLDERYGSDLAASSVDSSWSYWLVWWFAEANNTGWLVLSAGYVGDTGWFWG